MRNRGGNTGEDGVLVAIIPKVRPRGEPACVAQGSRVGRNEVQTSRIGKVQRREQYVGKDTENRRINPDSRTVIV